MKSWNLEFRASKIMKSAFYYTNPERKDPIKNLEILFKYNFIIKWPNNAIIIMAMIFHWYDAFRMHQHSFKRSPTGRDGLESWKSKADMWCRQWVPTTGANNRCQQQDHHSIVSLATIGPNNLSDVLFFPCFLNVFFGFMGFILFQNG